MRAVFHLFGMLNVRGIWPTIDLVAKLQLIMTSALPIGVASAIMLVAGYYLGSASAPKLLSFKELHPKLYYSACLIVVLLCWIAVIL